MTLAFEDHTDIAQVSQLATAHRFIEGESQMPSTPSAQRQRWHAPKGLVLVEGCLSKKRRSLHHVPGGGLSKWRRRYFSLYQGALYEFQDKDDASRLVYVKRTPYGEFLRVVHFQAGGSGGGGGGGGGTSADPAAPAGHKSLSGLLLHALAPRHQQEGCRFDLYTEAKVFAFKAESAERAEEWVRAIQFAMPANAAAQLRARNGVFADARQQQPPAATVVGGGASRIIAERVAGEKRSLASVSLYGPRSRHARAELFSKTATVHSVKE